MPLKTAVPSARRISAAGPIGQHQRNNAENKGEGGHQNRTQPQPAGLDGRVRPVQAGVLPLPGEFDDQDGVLAGQPDQHDKADLRENIVVHAARPDAERWQRAGTSGRSE